MTNRAHVITALSQQMPSVLRWSGSLARLLRQHQIAVENKQTGSALTDALTLSDLSIQDLLVSALRDLDPVFQECAIQAEEKTGDLHRFPAQAELTISLDPIDGTKQYRDRSGNGYAVMLHLRDNSQVLYSLVYIPEQGAQGTWVEVTSNGVRCGSDDPAVPALQVLQNLPYLPRPQGSKKIYLIGFQKRDGLAAKKVTEAGLIGVHPDEMPGSIYPLMAAGEFAGSLIHTPNFYDFPVSSHIARFWGGDAVWVQPECSVHFRDSWLDERASMLRLPGIVACSYDPEVLNVLVQLAKNWNPERYHTGESL